MNSYSIALFLHVCGDAGIFIGLGVQLLSLAALQRAQSVEQVRAIVWLIPLSDRVGVISALLTIVTGLYMALTVWGWQTGWIIVALASIILFLPLLIGGVIEPRTRAIVMMARETPDGLLPEALDKRIHDPILGAALQTMAALLFGLVFLMTIKLSLVNSIIVMAIALALGLVSGLLFWRTRRRQSKMIRI
jgi:ABC-type spermidine/putrescine transport system permease subunit II